MRTCAVFLLATLTAAAQSPAQNWDNVKAFTTGTEVRIAAGSRTIRGEFIRATDDTLVVASGKGQETFTQQEITRVSMREHSHRGRNSLVGLGIGVAAGLIIGAAPGCASFCLPRGAEMAAGAILLGGLGALAGALMQNRGWREVYKQ